LKNTKVTKELLEESQESSDYGFLFSFYTTLKHERINTFIPASSIRRGGQAGYFLRKSKQKPELRN